MFCSGQASSGLDVIVTSSSFGIPGQKGLDWTAMDIQQFVTGVGLLSSKRLQSVTVFLRTVRRTG